MKLTFMVSNQFSAAIDKVSQETASWHYSKSERFENDWDLLMDAGAEMFDISMTGLSLQVLPSNDFIQHCAKYGVSI